MFDQSNLFGRLIPKALALELAVLHAFHANVF